MRKFVARAAFGHALPNLRFVVRDKPHSARCLLQRTLSKYLCSIALLANLLWSRGYLARLAQHSAPHRTTLRRHAERHMGRAAATVKNLSYAEHRCDSTARPLGRVIIHFKALALTTVGTSRERTPTNPEHRGANNALDIRSTESMIQLGMVADACEIVVRFIRPLDKECFDASALPSLI